MTSSAISSNTKSCYPFLPRFDGSTYIFGLIGNDLFIASFRPFSVHSEESSLGQLLIYVQCGERLATIDVPYKRNDASRLQLLGFSNSYSIRALVRLKTGNEVEVHLTEMILNLELEEARITRQERVLSLSANDSTTTLVPIFQPHEPWFLLVRRAFTTILELFQIDGFIVTEIGRIDSGLRCLFATKYDTQLFLLCYPAGDYNSNFVVLKSYDLDTGLVEIVNEFTPPESWVLPQNLLSLNFACFCNLIAVFHVRSANPVFVFDVSQNRGYEVESPSCARSFLNILPSGEALMFAKDGCCLQSIWLKPPSLSHIAMKYVLMYIPAKTRDKLHSAMIVRPVELLQFLA